MNTRRTFRSFLWPWVFIASGWAVGASMACVLTSLPVFHAAGGGSIAARLFGSGISALGTYSLHMADRTIHGGRPYSRDTAFTNDIFQCLRREISPENHAHLQGEEVKEIMPWLRFAMALDPRNDEYPLITAYWLANEAGRPDAALKELLEAEARNPDSYPVQMGKGRFYAKGDNRERAKRAYDRALGLWPSGRDPADEEVLEHKREILARREVLYELDGDVHGAIRMTRELLSVVPDKSGLFRERLAALERGEAPRVSALDRWNVLRNAAYHHFCEEGERSERDHGDDVHRGHGEGHGRGDGAHDRP